MSALDVRSVASVPAEPWRNGGGVTRTLAAQSGQWRVSLAEIERDGPYSRFEGISRTSFVLRGAGVTLQDDKAVVRLKPFEAVEYDGNVAWLASLVNGPVTALNVMTAQGRYRTQVRVIVEPIVVEANCAAIVIALDGSCAFTEVDTNVGGKIETGQMLVIDNVSRPFRVAPSAMPQRAILVTIAPSRIRIND